MAYIFENMINLTYKEKTQCSNCKTSKYLITDNSEASLVCTKCGLVAQSSMIHDGQDWNNYEEGVNNSRVGSIDEINPYSTCGTYIRPGTFMTTIVNGKTVKFDLSKLHTQMSYTSKQRSYDTVAKMFKELEHRGINSQVVLTSQRYWATIMDNGTHRGSIRKGIIASCILYSCRQNNCSMSRQDIADILKIEKEDITKGEQIFKDMVKGSKIEYVLQLNSNIVEMFNKNLNKFTHDTIKFHHTGLCISLYDKFKDNFVNMKPTTVVGGIITYILKDHEGLKKPTKGEICETIGITNPTVNKILKEIKRLIESEKETFKQEVKTTVNKKKKIIPTEKIILN